MEPVEIRNAGETTIPNDEDKTNIWKQTLKLKVRIVYDISKESGKDFLDLINTVFPIANNNVNLDKGSLE